MRPQPRPDQPPVRMIDERGAPLVQTVFSFGNGGVKILRASTPTRSAKTS